jgi:dynein light chain Tctex-type 1
LKSKEKSQRHFAKALTKFWSYFGYRTRIIMTFLTLGAHVEEPRGDVLETALASQKLMNHVVLYEGSASQEQVVQLLDEEDEGITFHHMRDEIQRLIGGTVEELFDMDTQYDPTQGVQWADYINSNGLKKLAALNPDFKYIVVSNIVEKLGGGIHVNSSCLYVQATDGSLTCRWENSSMHVLVHVFALSMNSP